MDIKNLVYNNSPYFFQCALLKIHCRTLHKKWYGEKLILQINNILTPL